jgi:hypothetical protein
MAHTAVYGIFSSRQDTEMAIDAMRAAGFRAGDISVLFPDNQGTKDIGHEKHTKAPEKATAGAAIAGVAGGALGWLAGIGALAIPGVGPFIAAGPIMAALAGLGAGTVVGGFTGALIGAGIPEYEAKRYEGRIRSGGILLSVHCEDDLMIGRAKELLKHTGAEDVAAAEEGHVKGGPTARSEDTPRVAEHRNPNATTEQIYTADTPIVPRAAVVPEREVVIERDAVITPTPDERVSDRVIIEDQRPGADTRRIVREERVLTEEELRRRREVDPPPPTELL